MSDSDELLYSSEASATRYMYYQDLNDINIFVEDSGKEYEYETIFKRLLGENYKIRSIFSAGGKSGVEDRFEEFGINNPSNPKIKNLYIVDGDFDRYINSEEMIENPYFIYLKTYNIENYFIDEDACVQFSKGRLKCLDHEVKEKLKFSWWRDLVVGQATKLFLAYSFVKKYYPEHPTVSRSTGEFIDATTGFERQDGAFDRYWDFVNSLDNRAEAEILIIKEKYIDINGEDFFNLICGKFLLDSLCWYIRVIIESKFNHDDFKWHLINHFDISKLDYVKDSITELMSA
ncbi:hypothetical protein A8F94_08715 [Bacillus sp. FJAT-27225]|uniref:DUF4435 domain-containing protein n=1 Tax=Bacillus sp. FJAT-27225 TaxID=1743144 RepID=UPI00080C34E4|nr:DUF4435 domain-containing protein [Bacillus sp. FJAT-27225]OCA87904.1 hypothetical protein A8F94_08715 [Bacillus sp. FJAT-27225]